MENPHDGDCLPGFMLFEKPIFLKELTVDGRQGEKWIHL